MRISIKNLMIYSPWEIAKDNSLGYTGDLNFVQHGGTFYEFSNWAEFDYADCVNIYSTEGRTYVERGTINKPDDMSAALKCSGIVLEDEESVSDACEIEAALAYRGYESDSAGIFEVDDEHGICRHVKAALLLIKGA